MESVLTKKQTKKLQQLYSEDGKEYRITATIRYDDECGNGHNSFSITGEIWRTDKRVRDCESGGCIHDEIAKHFPELQPYLKWHLCASDGPMHYVANTVYHAGDRDCHGLRRGDPSRFEYGVRFGDSPVTHRCSKPSFYNWMKSEYESGRRVFEVVGIAHDREPQTYGTHYTFAGYGEKWHECPFTDLAGAREWAEALNRCKIEWIKTAVSFSDGKERDLDAARSAAIWPDATDAELSLPPAELTQKLLERLPALMADFRAAVESLGFVF